MYPFALPGRAPGPRLEGYNGVRVRPGEPGGGRKATRGRDALGERPVSLKPVSKIKNYIGETLRESVGFQLFLWREEAPS